MAPNPNQPIAKFLKSILAERDWTQEEMADQLGISTGSVNQWIKGRTMPGDENLIKIAKLCDCV